MYWNAYMLTFSLILSIIEFLNVYSHKLKAALHYFISLIVSALSLFSHIYQLFDLFPYTVCSYCLFILSLPTTLPFTYVCKSILSLKEIHLLLYLLKILFPNLPFSFDCVEVLFFIKVVDCCHGNMAA